MKIKYNQVLAFLLAVMMVISLLPMAALAADGELAIAEPVEETTETAEETTETTEETTETTEETEEVAIVEPDDGVIEAVTATVVTGSAFNVTGNTAMLSMTCTKSAGNLGIGFDVILAGGEVLMYTPNALFGDALDNQTITMPVEGLVPGVTYQFRAIAAENWPGEWVSFTTPADAGILEMTLGQAYDAAYNGYKLTPETSGTYRFAMDGAGYIEIHAADGTDVDAAYSNEGATAVELSVSLTAGETYYIWSVSEKDDAKISASIAPTGDSTEVKASTDSISTAADGTVKAYGYFTVPDSSYDIGFSLGTAEDGSYYGSTSWEAEGKMANERFGTALDWNPLVPGVTYYYRAFVSNQSVMGDITYGETKSFVAPQRSYEALAVGGSKTLSSWTHESYAFTPTESGSYKLSLSGGAVTVFDSMGVRLGDEDDALTFAATAGKTYYIGASNGYTEGTRQLTLTKTSGETSTNYTAETGDAVVNGSNVTLYGAYTLPELSQNQYDNICCGVMWGVKAYEAIGGGGHFGNYEQAGKSMAFDISDVLVPGVTYYYWAYIEDMADSRNFTRGEAKTFTAPAREYEALEIGKSKALDAAEIVDSELYVQQYQYCFTAPESGSYKIAGSVAEDDWSLILALYTSDGQNLGYAQSFTFTAERGEKFYIVAENQSTDAQTLAVTSFEPSVAETVATADGITISDGLVLLNGTFSVPVSYRSYYYGFQWGKKPYEAYSEDGTWYEGYGEINAKSVSQQLSDGVLVPGKTYYYWPVVEEISSQGLGTGERIYTGTARAFTAPERSFDELTPGQHELQALMACYYSFAPAENGVYELSLTGDYSLSAPSAYVLAVYDADGNQIVAGASTISFAAVANETYYLYVRDCCDEGKANLSLTKTGSVSADGVVAVGTARSISVNKTYALTIGTAGWYSFTSGSADKLTEMTVRASDGSIALDYNVGTAGSRLTDQVQLAAGVYTIEVSACADNAKLTVSPFAANESLAFAAATNSALKVSATGATLSGNFTAPKIDTGIYLMGFEYRVKGTTDTSVVWADTGVQQIESEEHRKVLTNLTAGKTYEYRAFIDPSYGEQMVENGYYSIGSAAVYGQWVMFAAQTESSVAGFSAVTGDPVVSGGKVTLSGTFTMPASDAENAYWYGVEYGTEPYVMLDGNNGQFGSAALAGQKKSYEVDTQIQLLVPGATYYCWALIRSGDMSMTRYSRGEVKTFTAPNSTFETLTTDAAKTAPAHASNHYCFKAGETGSYSLSLDCNAEGDLYLTVYNSKGEMIAQELDLGCVSFSATAGEKYYIDAYVGASEAGTLTIAKAATKTITLGQKVSGAGPFEISLTEGRYFIEADNDSLVRVYQGSKLWRSRPTNNILHVMESAVYRFVPSTDVTNFRIVSLRDATLPTIAAGETKTFTTEKEQIYFRFTAAQAGKYMICFKAGGATYYPGDGEDGFYCEDGTIVQLAAKDSIVVQLYNYERSSGEALNGELSIIDLASAKFDSIELEQAVARSGSSIFSFTPESAGFYVVETANGSARATSSEGYYMPNQVDNGKTLFLMQSASECYVVIRQTAAGGTVKLRKAVDSDFSTMAAGVSYNAMGFYRFTPQEASNYELITYGEASAYLSNGRYLVDAYGTKEEAAKGYLYLLSGQSAYVYVAGESTTMQKYTPAALNLGTPVALTDEIVRYRFTAETAGTYVIRALGSNGTGAAIQVSDSQGRSIAYAHNDWYQILSLDAGQSVYVDLSNVDGDGTAVVDKQENMIAGDLTLGQTKTTSDAYQLWRFVPQQSGLYVASVPTWTTVYELYNAASSAISRNDLVVLLPLEEGRSYYFVARDPDEVIQVESAEQFGATAIEQGQSVTPNDVAIYRFTAPEAGLYLMKASSWGACLYVKGVLDYCGDVTAVSLAKGEQVYLCATPYMNEGSLSINRINVETAGTKIGVDTYTVDKAGNYVFRAPADGTYVVSAERGLAAIVTWEDGARRSEYTSGDTLSLGTLKAGSCAFIQTYLEWPNTSGTLTITKLADWPQKTAALGENTKLDTTALYRFTAPEAGEYTFSMTMPPAEYAYARVYDQTMTEWDIYIDEYEQTTTTVSMLAGDSVYINVGRGTAATVLNIEKMPDADDKLGDILNDVESETAAEEIRSAVQEIGKEELAAAMNGEKGDDVVKKLDALEKSTGSGSVSIVVEESAQDVVAKENVTIVGATLNELAEDGADVKLTISATEEQELPTVVDASKAVFLQFDLEGVESPAELAVPVCITMEVPEGIQWELVRLVHHTENSYEILYPSSYVENGVRYARFVIGGFSPFTLTELAHTPGDVDGDGDKDIMDVLALLKSVAGIPSKIVYGDVNNSGAKDIMDVLSLLKSVAGISSKIY